MGQAVSTELLRPKDAGEFTCWVKVPLKSMMITRGSLDASARSRSLNAVIQVRMPPWMALAAAAPAVTLSNVIPVSTPAEANTGQIGGIYYKDDLLIEPMRLVDGFIEVPSTPGLGAAVDEAKIAHYRVPESEA